MLRAEEQAPEMTAGETGDRPVVIRTGRGLTIVDTRITLYQILLDLDQYLGRGRIYLP